MNDKFFDLKKEKQDRMINAALKIFALNGYKHASTDDIVREAGISKGLLFHYFGSKLGLYSFIYDYSVKYMNLELSTGVSKEETDFFKLLIQIETSKLQVLKNYPYMQQFLNSASREDVKEALLATEEKKEVIKETYSAIFERTDNSLFSPDIDLEKLTLMLNYVVNGLMTDSFLTNSFQPEIFHKEVITYFNMMQSLTYR